MHTNCIFSERLHQKVRPRVTTLTGRMDEWMSIDPCCGLGFHKMQEKREKRKEKQRLNIVSVPCYEIKLQLNFSHCFFVFLFFFASPKHLHKKSSCILEQVVGDVASCLQRSGRGRRQNSSRRAKHIQERPRRFQGSAALHLLWRFTHQMLITACQGKVTSSTAASRYITRWHDGPLSFPVQPCSDANHPITAPQWAGPDRRPSVCPRKCERESITSWCHSENKRAGCQLCMAALRGRSVVVSLPQYFHF